MGHHHRHHHQDQQQQQYGAYSGDNSGYYEGSSYAQGSQYGAPPLASYPYEQQPPMGYGGYGSAPPPPYGAVQPYGSQGYGYPQPSNGGAVQPYAQQSQIDYLRADEQKHRTNEHRAEAVALGAAAFAAYEHHEVKVDPQHAEKHRMEERMGEVTAVGAAGYALYEHKQSRHDHQALQAAGYNDNQGRHNKHEKHHPRLGFL